MAEAKRDQNHVTTMLGVSDADGTTPMNAVAEPIRHAVSVDDGVDGSDLGENFAARDQNHVPVLMAVSAVDGVTPVPLYIDGDGSLKIQST
jgi:hypothetical protein